MTWTRMLLVCGAVLAGCQKGDGGDEGMTDSASEGDSAESSAETAVPTSEPTVASDPTVASEPTTDMTTEPTAPTDPTGNTTDPEACDPAGCVKYCDWARCLFDDDIDGAKCLDACNTNCGDGSFESSDRDLLACQSKVSTDFNCADSQACCDEVFTNQICPD